MVRTAARTRSLLVASLIGLMFAGVVVAGAAPVPAASLASAGSGTRIVVTVTGSPRPSAISVRAAAATYRLQRSGTRWRSAIVTGARKAALNARVGKAVSVRMRVAGRTRAVSTTLGAAPAPAPAPAPAVGTSPPGTTAPGIPGTPSGGLTGQAAIDRFGQLLAGSRMVRVRATASGSSQSTMRLSFCASGSSLVYYYESSGNYTASSETAQATYSVTQAAFNAEGTIAEARVQYQASPTTTSLGASGQVIIRLTQNIAYIGSLDNEYQWTAGAAGC